MVSTIPSKSPPVIGEPVWDIARLFPNQGYWSDAEYLSLDTNHLVELNDGCIEVLEMPKPAHQRIVLHVYEELRQFVRPAKRGEVLVAPMPVRLRPAKVREPDVMFMLAEHSARKGEKYWDGADLVMEVVSDDAEARERDLLTKRADYAEAGVPEYWIIDPQEQKILVLSLHRGQFIVHGEFSPGQAATSVLLPGFSVDVAAVFAAANQDA